MDKARSGQPPQPQRKTSAPSLGRQSQPVKTTATSKSQASTGRVLPSSTTRKPLSATGSSGATRSKFAAFNRPAPAVADGAGVSAVFGKLDLLSDDVDKENSSKVPEQILKQARKSGLLNLSGRALIAVPAAVWQLHDTNQQPKQKKGFSTDRIEEEDAWWENVDLNKLILASNQLICIPPDIQNLHALTVLDLHDNCLETLPDEIGTLENLIKVNLNHNRLIRLPDGFYALKNLRSLSACHNGMTDISDEIGRLDQLEQLDLSHNNLTELPKSIGYLTKVLRLDLGHNNISSLPPQLGAMRCMIYFNASNNNLTDVGDTLEDLARLEQVYLHYNQLVRVPHMRNCPNLKELHLGFNRIKEINDDDVENIPAIKLLDLRDNQIQTLPDGFVNLQTLERLDLSNNDFSGLPAFLGIMPHIKSLNADGNPMKTIRRDILQRGTHELLKFLRSRIDESEMARLRETGNISPGGGAATLGSSPPVPDKFAMRASQMMNMSKKELTLVPPEAVENAHEARVTGVDLSKNLLVQFPNILEPIMPQLFQFDISFNRLETISSIIGLAANLQYLNVSNNKLRQLPDEVGQLPQLREICISFNRFDAVPNCIYKASNLEILMAGSNQITTIDVEGLSKLGRLTVVDFQNNNIEQVPPLLGRMTQVRSLQLEGNAFRVPRPQILAKGTESIMSYLRDRIPKEES